MTQITSIHRLHEGQLRHRQGARRSGPDTHRASGRISIISGGEGVAEDPVGQNGQEVDRRYGDGEGSQGEERHNVSSPVHAGV